MSCEKCGGEAARPYTFHYGKKMTESTSRMGGQVTTRITYEIGGSREVQLCKRCVYKSPGPLFFFAAYFAFTVICIILAVKAYKPGDTSVTAMMVMSSAERPAWSAASATWSRTARYRSPIRLNVSVPTPRLAVGTRRTPR